MVSTFPPGARDDDDGSSLNPTKERKSSLRGLFPSRSPSGRAARFHAHLQLENARISGFGIKLNRVVGRAAKGKRARRNGCGSVAIFEKGFPERWEGA
jgi:hypothetical protein